MNTTLFNSAYYPERFGKLFILIHSHSCVIQQKKSNKTILLTILQRDTVSFLNFLGQNLKNIEEWHRTR